MVETVIIAVEKILTNVKNTTIVPTTRTLSSKVNSMMFNQHR